MRISSLRLVRGESKELGQKALIFGFSIMLKYSIYMIMVIPIPDWGIQPRQMVQGMPREGYTLET